MPTPNKTKQTNQQKKTQFSNRSSSKKIWKDKESGKKVSKFNETFIVQNNSASLN